MINSQLENKLKEFINEIDREYFDFQYYSRIYNEAEISRIRNDDYFAKKVDRKGEADG